MKKCIHDKAYESYVKSQLSFVGHAGEKARGKNICEYIALFSRFMPKSKNAEILDIGCGMGEFLSALKKIGFSNFEGIDLSKQCVAHCHKIGLVDVQQEEMQKFLENKENFYDLIVMIDVLEHVEKKGVYSSISMVRKALKKGGKLILRVPNMDAPFVAAGKRYCDLTHVSGFTIESLNQLLRIVGFSGINFYNQETNTFRHKLKKTFIKKPARIFLKLLYYCYSYTYPRIDTYNLICIAEK